MGSMDRICPYSCQTCRFSASAILFLFSFARLISRFAPIQCPRRNDTGRPHHVEDTGDKAEQHKNNHAPRRNSEPVIERPTDRRADENAGDELAGEPKTAGNRSRIGGGRLALTLLGDSLGMDAPFTETTESRGERSLVVRRLFSDLDAGNRSRIGGGRLALTLLGDSLGMDAPFTETTESRGERSLVVRRLF